jgi:hypothetical protein
MENLLDLTPEQEKRRRQIERRMNRALKDFRDLAVVAGCRQPDLFFDGSGVYVFDLALGSPNDGSPHDRQQAIVLEMILGGDGVVKGCPQLGCGSW